MLYICRHNRAIYSGFLISKCRVRFCTMDFKFSPSDIPILAFTAVWFCVTSAQSRFQHSLIIKYSLEVLGVIGGFISFCITYIAVTSAIFIYDRTIWLPVIPATIYIKRNNPFWYDIIQVWLPIDPTCCICYSMISTYLLMLYLIMWLWLTYAF